MNIKDDKPIRLNTIIKLMEVRTLGAGIIPVIIGTVYSKYAFDKFNFSYLVLLLVAIILIQGSTNMINDYYDFKRGADSKKSGEEKALVSGEITPRQVVLVILIFQIIAFSIGIFVASQTSYYIMVVGICGSLISVCYATGPLPISFMPIGEVVSGVTMGLGITTTLIYVQGGVFNLSTVLIGIPTSIFISTILLSNNLSDIELDKEVGRKTLPILIGRKRAEKLWICNILIMYILTVGLVLIHIYPWIVLLTVSFALPNKAIAKFLSYEKGAHTKKRTMELIGKVGLKYHLAVIIGILIAIII